MNGTVLLLKITGIAILIAYIRYRIFRFENDILIQNTWQEHIVNFKISTKEFYRILEQMILEKGFPEVYIKQVGLHESEWPSRKRVYMRITHKAIIYFVFSAPMGEDFFISYRMGFRPELVANKDENKTFYQSDSEKAFIASMHKVIIHTMEVIIKQYGDRQFKLKRENDST
jgi:hypothetical protein